MNYDLDQFQVEHFSRIRLNNLQVLICFLSCGDNAHDAVSFRKKMFSGNLLLLMLCTAESTFVLSLNSLNKFNINQKKFKKNFH